MKHGYREALRAAVSGESKAYGFALVTWGTGALTVSARGLPHGPDVISYVGGALAAMALIVLLSFGGPTATWTTARFPRLAWGAIHVVSVAVGMAVGWAVADAVTLKWLAYFGAGGSSALVFQLVLGLEVALTVDDHEDENP